MKECFGREFASSYRDRGSWECQPGARWRWRWRCARTLQASPRQKFDVPLLYQLSGRRNFAMQVWDHADNKCRDLTRGDNMQQEDAAATRAAEGRQLGAGEVVLEIGDDADEVQQPTIQVMKTS
jgi:hypothetical protein